jgi:hypothetical protein
MRNEIREIENSLLLRIEIYDEIVIFIVENIRILSFFLVRVYLAKLFAFEVLSNHSWGKRRNF